MTVGVLTFELYLPGARSLKDMRQIVRSLKERLPARHNVAVSELEEHADLWQRATLAIVSVAVCGRARLPDPLRALAAPSDATPDQKRPRGQASFPIASREPEYIS